MSKEEAIKAIIKILTLIQDDYGENPIDLNSKSIPDDCLPNFDSLRKIEVNFTLSEKYNLNFKLETALFSRGKKALTIEDAAEILSKESKVNK